MAHRYQLQYRPLALATAPKGYLPDSAVGIAQQNWSRHNFGSIAYAEPLTSEQIADFELRYIGEETSTPMAGIVDEREAAQWYTCNSSMTEITSVLYKLPEPTRAACRTQGLLVGWMRLPAEAKTALRAELQRIHDDCWLLEEKKRNGDSTRIAAESVVSL
jgi:hypothetical protein